MEFLFKFQKEEDDAAASKKKGQEIKTLNLKIFSEIDQVERIVINRQLAKE